MTFNAQECLGAPEAKRTHETAFCLAPSKSIAASLQAHSRRDSGPDSCTFHDTTQTNADRRTPQAGNHFASWQGQPLEQSLDRNAVGYQSAAVIQTIRNCAPHFAVSRIHEGATQPDSANAGSSRKRLRQNGATGPQSFPLNSSGVDSTPALPSCDVDSHTLTSNGTHVNRATAILNAVDSQAHTSHGSHTLHGNTTMEQYNSSGGHLPLGQRIAQDGLRATDAHNVMLVSKLGSEHRPIYSATCSLGACPTSSDARPAWPAREAGIAQPHLTENADARQEPRLQSQLAAINTGNQIIRSSNLNRQHSGSLHSRQQSANCQMPQYQDKTQPHAEVPAHVSLDSHLPAHNPSASWHRKPQHEQFSQGTAMKQAQVRHSVDQMTCGLQSVPATHHQTRRVPLPSTL